MRPFKQRHSLDVPKVERRSITSVRASVKFVVPFPPAFPEKDDRGFASRQHQAWHAAAVERLAGQNAGHISGPVEITLTLPWRPNVFGIENMGVAVMNLLKRQNLIDAGHSSIVRTFTTRWSIDARETQIEITPSPMARAA